MNYKTRELVALREFQHADRYVHAGDTLHVTPIDAEHYLTRNMAREASAAPPSPLRRRRIVAAAPAAPAASESSDESSGDTSGGTADDSAG